MSDLQRKQRFIEFFTEKNSENLCILSRNDYESLIDEVIEAHAAKTKSQKQRRRIKRFDFVKENDQYRLIGAGTKQNPVYSLPIEDIFDILHTAHVSSGHGGRDRIRHALKKSI